MQNVEMGILLRDFNGSKKGDKVLIYYYTDEYCYYSIGGDLKIIPSKHVKLTPRYKAKVINLFGGSGLGKSTFAAKLFSFMKEKGFECELCTEFAKDLVWEGRQEALSCQPFVFGNQLRKIDVLKNKVDYIIVDSPLLLSIIYDPDKDINFKKYVVNMFNKFDNINFLIERKTLFNPNGRKETESQAREIDNRILSLLLENDINFNFIDITKSNIIRDVISTITN